METVTVQIKEVGKDWEQIDKVLHTFPNWQEVSKFAYRLALHFKTEVRVERNGNGYYYDYNYAHEFLKSVS